MDNKPVMISVIIPARNEEGFLPATLEALQRQTYRNFETIVVANGCKDRTADVARGYGARVFELGDRGLGPARNLGGKEATGQILLFLDADTLLDEDALKTIAVRFRRKYSAGTILGIPDNRRLAHKTIYALKNFIHCARLHCGSSGVILCWRDHFMEIGGFDEGLYLRENSNLMKRLRRFGGYTCIRQARATTSMRRYDTQGTLEMIRLWIKVWWRSNVSDIHDATYEDLVAERDERRQSRAAFGRSAQKAPARI